MPELPEAETIVRTLAPQIERRRIRQAEFITERVRRGEIPNLAGARVRRLERYGKQILWRLDRGLLRFELRMTGLLLWRETASPYTRARFAFSRGAVCFDDIRQFGSVRYSGAAPTDLGPDPFELDEERFIVMLRQRRRQLKPLLLDQHFLRGLGNIYTDEVLHRAGLHPQARASSLDQASTERLLEAIHTVLREAIAAGGSTVSDFLDARGQAGLYQNDHRVYGKTGNPCPVCGTPVRRIVVAQRGTHYCPSCQRL